MARGDAGRERYKRIREFINPREFKRIKKGGAFTHASEAKLRRAERTVRELQKTARETLRPVKPRNARQREQLVQYARQDHVKGGRSRAVKVLIPSAEPIERIRFRKGKPRIQTAKRERFVMGGKGAEIIASEAAQRLEKRVATILRKNPRAIASVRVGRYLTDRVFSHRNAGELSNYLTGLSLSIEEGGSDLPEGVYGGIEVDTRGGRL